MWLTYVKTGRARSKIRHYLKTAHRDEPTALGEKMLGQELRALGVAASDVPVARWKSVLRDSGNRLVKEVYTDIGLGFRLAGVVARRLLSKEHPPHLSDKSIDYEVFGHDMLGNISDSLSRAVVRIATDIGCKAVICSTRYGSTPRLIARLRAKARTYTFTPRKATARRLRLVWGVEAFYVPQTPEEEERADAPLVRELRLAIERELLQPGDRVALISGLSLENPEAANMLRVLEV